MVGRFHPAFMGFFGFELTQLKKAVEFAEDSIRGQLRDIDQRWKETEAAKLHPDEVDWIGDQFADEHYWVDEVFPQLLRRSLFLTAYAVLEQYLDMGCSRLGYSLGLALRPSDLKGRGIRRSALYLEKVVGLPFPQESPHWQTILRLQKIRNQLAHVGQYIEGDDLRKLVEGVQGVRIEDAGSLAFEEPFLHGVLDSFAGLYQDLTPLVGMLAERDKTAG